MTLGEWVYLPPAHRVTVPIGLYAVTLVFWALGAPPFWLGFWVCLCVVGTRSLIEAPLLRAWSVFWRWAARS